MSKIDVNPRDLDTVLHILRRHVPEREVLAFGSRVKWTAKDYSDLDLAVLGEEPLSAKTLAALTNDFDESSLPFKVDVADWATISESFREVIRRDRVTIKSAEHNKPTSDASEWHEVTIREIAEIYDGPHATPKKSQAGPVFLGISNIANGRFDLSNVEHISEDDFSRWTRRVAPTAGDVVFSYETRLGEAALVPSDLRFCLGRRMGLLRAKPDRVEPRFLLYAFLGPEFQATLRARTIHGSTVDRIPLINMPDFPIRIPVDLNEQRAIAYILGTLDDKIELNRRMNETLEAIARAIFKSWFVDFDPVRAKAEGRDPGLPKPLVDLFPARFVDSELGEIPAGWKVIPLPEAIEVNPTRSLRKGGVAPYLDMANMPSRGHSPDEVIERPFGSGMRFINGDTLVARITPCLENGKTAFVDFLKEGEVGWGSTEYIVLRPKSPLPEEFAYCLARSDDFREFAIQSMTGTSGRQRVPPDSLSHYLLAAPPEQLAKRFGAFVSPLFAHASAAVRESRTLATLRDTLLPKLISGELRIKQSDRALSEGVGPRVFGGATR